VIEPDWSSFGLSAPLLASEAGDILVTIHRNHVTESLMVYQWRRDGTFFGHSIGAQVERDSSYSGLRILHGEVVPGGSLELAAADQAPIRVQKTTEVWLAMTDTEATVRATWRDKRGAILSEQIFTEGEQDHRRSSEARSFQVGGRRSGRQITDSPTGITAPRGRQSWKRWFFGRRRRE
jgi:hypothetical protein